MYIQMYINKKRQTTEYDQNGCDVTIIAVNGDKFYA